VADQVVSRWRTWDLFGRFIGISILVVLVLNPTEEVWRQRSGNEVRFSNLALSGYTSVWLAAVLFNHRVHRRVAMRLSMTDLPQLTVAIAP
jgi:hypothetical protein